VSSDTDRAELRAIIFEAVTAAVEGLQRHLDEQVLELQADVDSALEKLDAIEIDVKDVRVHVAKLSREQIKDHRRDQALSKRLADIERRLAIVEKAAE